MSRTVPRVPVRSQFRQEERGVLVRSQQHTVCQMRTNGTRPDHVQEFWCLVLHLFQYIVSKLNSGWIVECKRTLVE
jgi:hypothetical protein